MYIIWKKPGDALAVTTLFDDSDPAVLAALLQERGDVPADWEAVATGAVEFPTAWAVQEDWRFVGGEIVISLASAVETTKQRLRREREPLFAANDLLLRDALLEGDEAKKAAGLAERDRLRDLPQLADAAVTLEELLLLKGG